MSDTVGFIKKLPHDLVASFKSTLDEALEASHLLHIVDAADPSWESQLEVTREVLAEIGAGEVPSTLVMNKIDLLDPHGLPRLKARYPTAWFVSARNPADITAVRTRIIDIFESAYEETELEIPYDKQSLVSEMHDQGRVVDERYEDDSVKVTWRAEPEAIARIKARLSR